MKGPALIAASGPRHGMHWIIGDGVEAGRHPKAAIFLDDVTVSRHHAAFSMEGHPRRAISRLDERHVRAAGLAVIEGELAAGDEVIVGRFRLIVALDAMTTQKRLQHRRGRRPTRGRIPRCQHLQDPLPRDRGMIHPPRTKSGVPGVRSRRYRAGPLHPRTAARPFSPTASDQDEAQRVGARGGDSTGTTSRTAGVPPTSPRATGPSRSRRPRTAAGVPVSLITGLVKHGVLDPALGMPDASFDDDDVRDRRNRLPDDRTHALRPGISGRFVSVANRAGRPLPPADRGQ